MDAIDVCAPLPFSPPDPDAQYSRSSLLILSAAARPIGSTLARFQLLPTGGWGNSRRSVKRAGHQVPRIPVATLKSDRTKGIVETLLDVLICP
jgi:hypothetical protein